MKNLVLGAVCLATVTFAQIDPLILVSGNSWLHKLVVMEGPTAPILVFEGTTLTVLDSIFWRNDTLYFSTSSKDSSFSDSATSSYKINYAVVDDTPTEIVISGNRPRHLQSGQPWFMVGSSLSGTLTYVRYDGKVRLQSQWVNTPGPTFGATTIYTYTQGIGLINYSYNLFGSMARGSVELRLLESNGEPFDSSQVEKLGSVTNSNHLRKRTSKAKSSLRYVPGSHDFLINGKRANNNSYRLMLPIKAWNEH